MVELNRRRWHSGWRQETPKKGHTVGEKNETLGRRIARLRLERDMTQERLARELGVTAQAVSKWENDLSAPDIMSLPTLARTLGVTVDELLGAAEQTAVVSVPEEGTGAEPGGTGAEPGGTEAAEGPVVEEPASQVGPTSEEPTAKACRLHIQIHDAEDGDDVNINVPLGLAGIVLRTGVGVSVFDNDVDTKLLADAIKNGEPGTLVEVAGPDGDNVTISLE